MAAEAVTAPQVIDAELTRLNCVRHPSSVTASDLLQMPRSEQQEMPRILWRVSPSLGRASVRWIVRSLAETRSTLATTFPYW